MLSGKCKNSVFCICFLFSFFVGTICGVFCYRLMIGSDLSFIWHYSKCISKSLFDYSLSALISVARPFVFVALLSLFSSGYRFIFPLVVLRGFLSAYTTAALWIGNCDLFLILVRGLVLLPAFYLLCDWSFFRSRNLK